MDLLRGAAAHRKPGARSTIILGRNPSPLDNGNKTIHIIKMVRGNETVKISHRLWLGRHDVQDVVFGHVDTHNVLMDDLPDAFIIRRK